MKNILLIGDFQSELGIIKSYLEEINAKYLEVSAVPQALRSTIMPDMIIVLANKNKVNLNIDIDVLQRQSGFSGIPRLFILPSGMSDFRPNAELTSVNGEPAFQLPVDKQAFLSTMATFLKIPMRRVFRIIITVQPDGSNIKYSGMSLDFSETGMSFQCVEEISVGQNIMVYFVNPKSRMRVSLRAVVARKSATQAGGANFYGVKFVEMEDEDSRVLKAFITGKGFV